jgi:hypothetical protein
MITIFNNSIVADLDMVSVSGCLNSSDMTCQASLMYDKVHLTPEQEIVHNNFVNLLNNQNIIKILNVDCVFSMDRMYNGAIEDTTEIFELDYNAMSAPDKLKVDLYKTMLIALAEEETN